MKTFYYTKPEHPEIIKITCLKYFPMKQRYFVGLGTINCIELRFENKYLRALKKNKVYKRVLFTVDNKTLTLYQWITTLMLNKDYLFDTEKEARDARRMWNIKEIIE